jgi:hypothetical protein
VDNAWTVLLASLTASIPYDFYVKATGKADLTSGAVGLIPLPSASSAARALLYGRALRLNCLTTHYAGLWAEVCPDEVVFDAFAKSDPRLESWSHLTQTWARDSALRTPYARRQALVELDALSALALNLTLDQLLVIYRVQLPVLQQHERETFYDQRGKIVFTVNKGLCGVGLDRRQWEEVRDAEAGDKLPDWAHDAQGPFVPPFDRCDREADMAQAYEHFSKLLGARKARS